MSQRRIDVTIAGQKITLATSDEHEPLLRSACQLVDEQIQLAIAGGNRSLERATMMAALKLAGDLITTKEDIDNGDVIEELPIFEIKDKEDYHLK